MVEGGAAEGGAAEGSAAKGGAAEGGADASGGIVGDGTADRGAVGGGVVKSIASGGTAVAEAGSANAEGGCTDGMRSSASAGACVITDHLESVLFLPVYTVTLWARIEESAHEEHAQTRRLEEVHVWVLGGYVVDKELDIIADAEDPFWCIDTMNPDGMFEEHPLYLAGLQRVRVVLLDRTILAGMLGRVVCSWKMRKRSSTRTPST